jgi:transposase
MRKVKEILRLTYENGLSRRQVAQSVALGRATITDYLRRFEAAGLTWPAAAALDDVTLERRLFPSACPDPVPQRPEPDWATVHQELRRKGVTLMLLWQEYKARDPDGYQYSWFCGAYRAWAGRRDLVMRQHHRAGEKLFIDYAGPTVEVIDRATGEVRQAQVFVAVLGASSYTYAEATWPARPYKPKDKAKAEVAVQVVERWILARLRHHTFFALAEVNRAIAALLPALNERPFQRRTESRKDLFEQLDRPALKPLPQAEYVYAEWRKAKPGIDYHVEVDRLTAAEEAPATPAEHEHLRGARYYH